MFGSTLHWNSEKWVYSMRKRKDQEQLLDICLFHGGVIMPLIQEKMFLISGENNIFWNIVYLNVALV